MSTPIVSDDASNSYFDAYFFDNLSSQPPQINPNPSGTPPNWSLLKEHMDNAISDLKTSMMEAQNNAIKESMQQQLEKLQDMQEKIQNSPSSLNGVPIHNNLHDINIELQEIAQVALVTQEHAGIRDLYRAIDEVNLCLTAF